MSVGTDTPRIADLVRRRRAATVHGRARELAELLRLLEADGPAVAYLHGPPGIGKTALLGRLAETLKEQRVAVAWIEGGSVEPQPGALDWAVSAALASTERRARSRIVVVIIDDVDTLRLVQTWLRRSLIPALPANVRVVLGGRAPPASSWSADFGELFLPLALRPIGRDAVLSCAREAGLGKREAEKIWAVSAGHPLGLRLSLDAARNGALDAADAPGALAMAMLDQASDRLVSLVEAAAVVRRATRPLLTAMLGGAFRDGDYGTFAALPFVVLDSEGHVVAEPVRRAIVARLAATEPDRHAALRRAAVAYITGALGDASPRERWRWMADLLHLVEEPQVRDAFFPNGDTAPAVEPATNADLDAAVAMVRDEAERGVIAAWARALPHRFNVARAADGAISAFYVHARHSDPLDALAGLDPLLASWRAHLAVNPVAGQALFVRKLLALRDGHDTPERTACMLDLKRAYFERWDLSRVYTVANPGTLASPVMRRLGFMPLGVPRGRFPGSMVLDLPRDGLVGWITALVGLPPDGAIASAVDAGLVFVRDRREVSVGGRMVRLTRLEAEVLAALVDAAPDVVTRETLIESVWRRAFVGSNVVDAVIRTLRRKLGPEGRRIATVPKAGYRYVEFSSIGLN